MVRTLIMSVAIMLLGRQGLACEAMIILSPELLCQEADLVVLAEAINKGEEEDIDANAILRDTVVFKVNMILKGTAPDKTITFEGYLEDKDDFNTNSVPYRRPRSGAYEGMCHPYNYRKGGQYLLFLQSRSLGKLSPYWVTAVQDNRVP